jgi:ABC-type multidrug transport system ATPase subunit
MAAAEPNQTECNVLQVSDANFVLKGGKVILDKVCLSVQSGELLAMMGPSGAGKTTLLELMTMKLSGKLATGSVTLNGEPLLVDAFHKYAALVEQYDSHWGFLTCREAMNYMARLCIPSSTKRVERVQSIMEKLGLLECADTKAGNIFLKGMSGGQKKRLSVGLALLKSPKLLFLDEPTSGLDAASTKACMKFLDDVAKRDSVIIVATIHQPATEVFMAFSSVLFLVNGRVAYNGPPSEVESYCGTIGKPLPPLTNPADHFISLVNSEFVGRDQVDAVVSAWPKSASASISVADLEQLVPPARPGTLAQCWILFCRRALLSVRDPTLYIGRMIVFLLANSFFAIIYIKARDREQKYAVSKFFLISWFLAVTSMFSVVVVFAINAEFNISQKEMHIGLARTRAYIVSRMLIQYPYMLLLSLSALGVPAYAIANFNPDGFAMSLLTMTAMLCGFEFCGEAFGIIFKNPLIGMLAAVGLWFCAFLFSGDFLNPDFIIWPFRVLCWCLPLRWSIRAMNYLEFHGTEWEGAELNSVSPSGFVCPGANSPLNCFGRTGDQVLNSLMQQFGNLSTEDTVAEDIAYCLIIAAVFKIIAIVSIVLKTRWIVPVRPIAAKSATGSAPPAVVCEPVANRSTEAGIILSL